MKLSGQQQMVVNFLAGAMIVNGHFNPRGRMIRTMHSLQRKGLAYLADFKVGGEIGGRYELTPKGKQHATAPYFYGIGPVVASSELTTLKMSAGNEKRYSRVIMDDDHVHLWVGIGWVDDGEPTNKQRNSLPRVYQREW